jgi:hypothetical protein
VAGEVVHDHDVARVEGRGQQGLRCALVGRKRPG